jgi:type VI secretion system protein VasG
VSLNLKYLIAKLNDVSRRSLENAAGLCSSRSNYNVEIEHWLLKLLESPDSDIPRLLKHFEVDQAKLERSLVGAIERFKTGNSRVPSLSPKIMDLVREAWLIASVEYSATTVRTGHLLLAMLANPDLALQTLSSAPQLSRISAETLQKELRDITSGTAEDVAAARVDGGASGEGPAAGMPAGTAALDQFTVDLTARAKEGKIDPVLGRDFEVRQMIDILMRRRQNNPILTGEAGVGKTAVVEGFALRIAAGDVPEPLKNVSVRTLDLGLLQAGAGVKGEFENRLKSVINEVKASPKPIILFIDEAHTMIGAGGSAGQGDAANLLKPALARGELRTIAATTWSEYKKYFEKDAALARRFQVIKVEEPNEEQAINMMRGFVATLEKHHGLRVLDEAISEAVRLSHRYISGRQLPDKSVSLLDTAAARVAIGHEAVPAQVEDLRRRLEDLDRQLTSLRREHAVDGGFQERIDDLTTTQSDTQTKLTALETRWQEEADLVKQIREIRKKLEAATDAAVKATAVANGQEASAGKKAAAVANGQEASAGKKAAGGKTTGQAGGMPATQTAEAPAALSPSEMDKLRGDMEQLNTKLRGMQGESPLMQVCVDGQTIAEVVAAWTGIPVGKMVTNEIKTVLTLRDKLAERIIGQSHALEAIAQRIQTARVNMVDPRRPQGVFMMVGPSGVGKTETAMALADILYGGDRNMVVINMSEYQESHTVSSLKGSPPGYVGFGEGGVLTEAVRRRPYSVVLLDEVEKAHNDVMELFYQVFDKGVLEDSEGREIDFKNTIIILTSNVGTDLVARLCAAPDTRPDPKALGESLRPELLKVFKPAFLGRMVVVPYYPLADDVLRQIVKLQLGRIADRFRQNHKAEFAWDDTVIEAVRGRCREVESGARNVDHILTGQLLPEISRQILGRMAEGQPITRVHVAVDGQGAFAYRIE